MKKLFLSTIALLAVVLAGNAFENISSSTARFLNQRKHATPQLSGDKRAMRQVKTTNVGGTEMVQCFVSLNGGNVNDITANGGVVNARFGNDLVVATLPVNRLEAIARSVSVKQVSVGRTMSLKSDTARSVTGAEKVWNGAANGLLKGYDGTGVVLGIIDDGIQYNHMAFKDANGKTRVARVYDPRTSAEGGSTVTIDGNTLTGRQYTTAEQIAALTTDDAEAYHGTHTTGCAAGTLVGKYSGMAPGVELVLSGLGEDLDETNIAEACLYIANYAKSVGKPCVISISLGSNTGPHDGSSEICQVYDQIASEYGAIIVLPTGNEADSNGAIVNYTISDSSTPIATNWELAGSFMYEYSGTFTTFGNVDIWNNSSNKLTLKLAIYNYDSDKGYYYVDMIDNIKPTENGTDVDISNYFGSNSYFTVYGGVNSENNRYNIAIDAMVYKNRLYCIGLLVYGNAGDKVSMWTDCYYSEFSDFNNYDAASPSKYKPMAGSGYCTICDDITGKNTISVGAWCSRLKYPTEYGSSSRSMSNSSYPIRFKEGDIAYFSSYGTDFNGVNHPLVTAPGHTVVAAVNRYYGLGSYSSQRETAFDGEYDYWGAMSGTSMATPVAAGVVALWKSINPNLTIDEIKDVIRKTSVRDSHLPADDIYWGAGKINALAGAKYILDNMGGLRGDLNKDGKVNVADVGLLYAYILGHSTGLTVAECDLNNDGSVNVSDVGVLYSIILQK